MVAKKVKHNYNKKNNNRNTNININYLTNSKRIKKDVKLFK